MGGRGHTSIKSHFNVKKVKKLAMINTVQIEKQDIYFSLAYQVRCNIPDFCLTTDKINVCIAPFCISSILQFQRCLVNVNKLDNHWLFSVQLQLQV